MKRLLPPIVSLLLLAGVLVEQRGFAPPADAEPYNARVRAAGARVPLQFGDWTGTDVALPYDAVQSLQPNLLISRRYVNPVLGEQAMVLLVQCDDARTLGNHFPPVCYPAQGYTLVSGEPRQWEFGARRIEFMQYEFSRRSFDASANLAVANFLVLPGGRIVRDMAPVKEAANDIHRRYYGAAEVQVIFDPGTQPDVRDAIVGMMAQLLEPVLRAVSEPTAGGGTP